MIYIVVIKKPNNEGTWGISPKDTTEMKTFITETQLLDNATQLGRNSGDPRRVTRIFSVDEDTNIKDYVIVFDGTLKLQETKRNIIE